MNLHNPLWQIRIRSFWPFKNWLCFFKILSTAEIAEFAEKSFSGNSPLSTNVNVENLRVLGVLSGKAAELGLIGFVFWALIERNNPHNPLYIQSLR